MPTHSRRSRCTTINPLSRSFWLSFLLLSLTLFTNNALANLCGKDAITDRYRDEAKLIKSETYSPSSPDDYQGDDEYNAWILACNRERDKDGKKIDKAISPTLGGGFADDLTPYVVKSKLKYYGTHLVTLGATTLKYRYRIHREAGVWYVTLPIKLKFPNKPLKNRLDISYELAYQLNLMSENGNGTLICDNGNQVNSTKKKKGQYLVDTGYIFNKYSERSCRLPRDYTLNDGTKLLDHYYDFWRSAIRKAWNR